MIDENWEDGIYYEVYFKTEKNKEFCRGVVVPFDCSEEEVVNLFSSSFKHTIEILDVFAEKDVWLSKEHFKALV